MIYLQAQLHQNGLDLPFLLHEQFLTTIIVSAYDVVVRLCIKHGPQAN
jgi:hypothetical protein